MEALGLDHFSFIAKHGMKLTAMLMKDFFTRQKITSGRRNSYGMVESWNIIIHYEKDWIFPPIFCREFPLCLRSLQDYVFRNLRKNSAFAVLLFTSGISRIVYEFLVRSG